MIIKCECGKELSLSRTERKLFQSVPSWRPKFAKKLTKDSLMKFDLVLSRLGAEVLGMND